ncbi:Triosephosphate isomerase [Hartmannibacter diazotrophicus]|uniref:Triosephosphate isomerase n=1 Tax=Hartmannibacter diazotrophicus TaxID=1482074 RepID=A0A2C9D4A7_9HYPH|nr:triose-phosphate isomerase [Hartmannibacter diazotrophicus]SON55063.1 Triosephosphate isomerase [Hartmannibacter diazotrophicus]
MTQAIKPLIAGNWKMNGLKSALAEIGAVANGYDGALRHRVDLAICPPATLVFPAAAAAIGSGIMIGGQDCHANASGAHTGDIAAEMLFDAGAGCVIVGHSERRADHGESDGVVRAKAEAALRAGLLAIVCVGETLEERDRGVTLDIVGTQLAGSLPDTSTAATVVIAYEPVWAIGTGRTPTTEDVAKVHGFIRETLEKRFGGEGAVMRILYGGSVKPGNAAELLAVPHVNGALVGGASLKAADFLGIVAGLGGA